MNDVICWLHARLSLQSRAEGRLPRERGWPNLKSVEVSDSGRVMGVRTKPDNRKEKSTNIYSSKSIIGLHVLKGRCNRECIIVLY